MFTIKSLLKFFVVLTLTTNLSSEPIKLHQEYYITLVSIEDNETFEDFAQEAKNLIAEYNIIIDHVIRPQAIWAEGPQAPSRNGKDSIALPDFLIIWHFPSQEAKTALYKDIRYQRLADSHKEIISTVFVSGKNTLPMPKVEPSDSSIFIVEYLYMDSVLKDNEATIYAAENSKNQFHSITLNQLIKPKISKGVELPDIVNFNYLNSQQSVNDFLLTTGKTFKEVYGSEVIQAGWVLGKSVNLFDNEQ